MNILFLYKEEWENNYVKEKLPGHNISFAESFDKVDADILNSSEILSVFINHQVKKEDLDKMPNLKLIATRSTGFDHIDVKAAREKNIEVVYVPSYGENTVAEFAFALILDLSRKISEAHEQVTETGSFKQGNLRGFDLKDKTIGIVGTGKIGINMVRISKGFGMNVIAHDPFPRQELSDEFQFKYVSFNDLLRESDIISLHAPLNESTHHMINTSNIHEIKEGAFLINTARGGLVETGAIEKALEEGIFSGIGLDVLEEESDMSDELSLLNNPNPKIEELRNVLANHYLIKHSGVIVTPHIAFNTGEAVKRILDTTVDNINSFTDGELKNRVP